MKDIQHQSKDSSLASGATHRHDVMVLGGGPAGATSALLLARQGLDVVLLERSQGEDFKVGESLPPMAAPLVERLGLLGVLNSGEHLRCYGNQSSWGSSGLQDTDFLYSPPGYGWHLDRTAFEEALLGLVAEAGGKVLRGFRAQRILPNDPGYEALGDNQRRAARFLIDATGMARFFLRRQQTLGPHDDRLVATMAFFGASPQTQDEDSRTLIEARSDGWWYTAQVPGRRRVVIQFTDAEDVGPRTENDFVQHRLRRTQHVAPRLFDHGYELVHGPHRKIVESLFPGRVAGSDWLAVGDAALSVDPLSSQGIWNALRTAEWSAAALARHLAGDPSALSDYQSQVEQTYKDYLAQRAEFYRREQRWTAQPFWQHRQL